jgi:hypothetical protein
MSDKKNQKADNVRIIILAIAILCWFKGMYRMMDNYINNTFLNNIVLISTAVIIMRIMDGDLSALGNDDKDDAAATGGINGYRAARYRIVKNAT